MVLPLASSFGAYFGLLHAGGLRKPAADAEGKGGLGPVPGSAVWLVLALVAIVAFVGLIGPGLQFPR